MNIVLENSNKKIIVKKQEVFIKIFPVITELKH